MSNPNLQKIIKLTLAQYTTLSNGGTVGGYTGLNDNYLYLIQDDTQYQPLDPDLTAIAALSGLGYLKRTGNNTWALENATFVDLTSNQVITGQKTFKTTNNVLAEEQLHTDIRLIQFHNPNQGASGSTAGNAFLLSAPGVSLQIDTKGRIDASGSSSTGGFTTSLQLPENTSGTRKTLATTDQIPSVSYPVTDVKVNNSSILNGTVANLVTYSAYDASTNPLATMSDLPTVNDSTISFEKSDGTFIGSFTTNTNSNQIITLPEIPTLANDVNDYGSKYVNPPKVRQYQIIFGIAPTLLTNINGHDLSGTYNTLDTTVGGFPVVKIRNASDNSNLTFDQSHNYMRKITGSEFTPTFGDGTVPQYSYIIDGQGMLYKPQWDSTNGLLLYKVNRLALYSNLPSAYLASASVSGNLLTITDNSGNTTTFASDAPQIIDLRV